MQGRRNSVRAATQALPLLRPARVRQEIAAGARRVAELKLARGAVEVKKPLFRVMPADPLIGDRRGERVDLCVIEIDDDRPACPARRLVQRRRRIPPAAARPSPARASSKMPAAIPQTVQRRPLAMPRRGSVFAGPNPSRPSLVEQAHGPDPAAVFNLGMNFASTRFRGMHSPHSPARARLERLGRIATVRGKEMLVPSPKWLDTGSNAWQMTAATFVGLQSVPGLVILYGGIVKENGRSTRLSWRSTPLPR